MAPGLSSVISRAMIEVFTREFLEKPGISAAGKRSLRSSSTDAPQQY
jgi:hypothetical protein